MDKITNNFFHSQTNSTTELGYSPPFLDFSRKLLVNGFLIMINYIGLAEKITISNTAGR